MARKIISVLAICLLAASVVIADDATNKPPKKGSAEQLQQLQQQLNEQQKQLQQQQEAILALQQQIEQAQVEARTPQLVNASMQTAPPAPKKQEVEAPLAIRYKGLSLIPGGFLEGTFIYRTRNQNADVASFPNGAPFGNTANAKLSELRASARSTRFSLLGQGMAGSTKLTGYYELDFYGGGMANQVTTNSYTPRMRHLFGQADFKNGFTITAGQTWSLLTTHRKGIATRAEFIPNVIDAMYVIGWQYARQVNFRVTKNFNNKVWAAVAVEAPETGTVAATGFNSAASTYNGLTIYGLASSPNAPMFVYGTSGINTSATNYLPDFIGKLAVEPGWGHYELSGLVRVFRDRVNATTATDTGRRNRSVGGGLKVAAILPVVPKKADLMFQAMAGNGTGRYGDLGAPDVTIKFDPAKPGDVTNGELVPIRTYHAMYGLELHPTPKLDIFTYGGMAYYARTTWKTDTGAFAANGYGSPVVNNAGCYGSEIVPAASCQAQNKSSQQFTAGYYYKLFRGNFGTFAYGMQYNYIHRVTWSGTNNGAVPAGQSPKGFDNVLMTGFRYFLP